MLILGIPAFIHHHTAPPPQKLEQPSESFSMVVLFPNKKCFPSILIFIPAADTDREMLCVCVPLMMVVVVGRKLHWARDFI